MRGEEDVRAAMQLLAADSPTVEDVIGVVRPSGEKRRRRVWILPVAAATVTLVVVLTVTALVYRGPATHQPAQVRPPAPTVTAFVGVHWTLVTFQASDVAPKAGEASLFIRRDGQFTAGFRCAIWQGRVQLMSGRAVFTGGRHLDHNCPSAATNEAATTSATESILDGAAQWSVRHHRLTVTKPGVGTLTYAPFEMAATIRGRLLAVGGPPGPARPLAGTVMVTANGGKPLMVTVGSDGRYSVTVAPGTYRVQGHSPAYQSGKWPCRAMRPADAATGTTTTVNVYCQEK